MMIPQIVKRVVLFPLLFSRHGPDSLQPALRISDGLLVIEWARGTADRQSAEGVRRPVYGQCLL